jgi:hypothetical protein
MSAELKLVPMVEAAPTEAKKRRPRTEEEKAKRRITDKAFRDAHREQVRAKWREASAKWTAAHPELHTDRTRKCNKAAYDSDPERGREVRRRWRAKHAARMPELVRRWNYRKYGLDGIEEYERIFAAQNGVCAICREPETETLKGVVKRLAIDHDHQNGTVRGLLCAACNQMLGRAYDSPARLRAAADYLEKAK